MKQTPPNRESWAAAKQANAQRVANAKPRNRVLVIVDIIASVALLIFGLGVAILVPAYANNYLGALQSCTPSMVDGLVCNGTVLTITSVALIAVAILAFLLAIGMVIVSLIRRRWSFWWPLGAIILTLGLFYLGTWIVTLTFPPA